ncbi:serine hydrolase [Actinoplanes sp. NPDC049265]|uniref:serine hydrolase n=1 Tax=Actinoplanes sp. NPDC049265 TaxID=3363902 RepID=UPI00371C10B3
MSLPRSTPAEQGVDARGIDAFLAALDPLPDVELHSLMVVKNGHVVGERWWRPYGPDRPHLMYSLSKSFTSTALGFAVAEGLVELDATVLSYFPEWDGRVADERSRRIRVRDVAAMASGHAAETVDEALAKGDGDMVLGLLLLPPEYEPGTFFAYNQPCTNALSAIVRRVSDGTLTDFLASRLFEPLEIGTYGWWLDRNRRELGYSGLHVTTEAVAKLGQLYLEGGRDLLPASWVAEATRAHVITDREEGPDWSQGYGFQFWRGRHGYRGDGAYGQFMLVLPEAGAVVALTGQSEDTPALLDAVWTHLLPALTADDGPAGAWPVEWPELPGPAGATADGGPGEWPDLTAPFAALPSATFTRDPAGGTHRVHTVSVTPTELTLDDGRPVIAGWGDTGGPLVPLFAFDGDRIRVDVVFVESPHRLRLTLDPAAGTFVEDWQTEPLGSTPLGYLRMPTTSR